MFSKRAIMSVIVLALATLLILPVYAGAIIAKEITSFTGDCNSATVTWKSNLNFTRITIINETTGATLVNGDEAGPSGTYTATFTSPLEDGTVLSVTIDPEPDAGDPIEFLVVSCNGSSASGRYIQMCADGRANTNLCEPVAIYPIKTDDGTGIAIWDVRRGVTPRQLLYIAAESIASLPDGNCELSASADGFATVIVLGGHIVVIAGPDDENKTFIFFFEEFPNLPVTDTTFGQLVFNLPACFD